MNGDLIELRDGDNCARVSTYGAELTSWRAGGIEAIWRPDPAFWDRTSPILFPVVGWCRNGRIKSGGRCFPMGVHGFAAHSRFEIAARGERAVTMTLRDSAATRAHYPFAFELVVDHRLDGAALSIQITVRNRSEEAMPFACGVHPGFRWPLDAAARGEHVVEFEHAESPRVPVITADGLFSAATRAIALDGRRLALDDDVFAQEALCFLDARSRAIEFAGRRWRLRAVFENFRHLALWSRPGAPFLCVEGWTCHGDREDFDGAIAEKAGMILLAPGAESRHGATFWLTETARGR